MLIGQYVRIKSHIFTTDFSQNESETNSVQSCAVARWPAELTEPCHGCFCRDSFSNEMNGKKFIEEGPLI